MRIYDPRLGKFLSVDPLTKKYPQLTPYQFASNSPICSIDLDGLEGFVATGVGGHGMIVRPEQADAIVKRTVVTAFKATYTDALPKKLIEQYAYGGGKPIILNKSETVQVKSMPTGLTGITAADNEKFNALMNDAKPGSVIQLPQGYAVQGAALTGGTLGRFTIQLEGKITVDKGDASKWSFEGSMQFKDRWDFETNPVNNNDLQRSDWGNTQTEFARKNLPGQGFDISSEKLPIKQSSGDASFDWYNGKPTDGKQSEVTNFQADHPTEGAKVRKDFQK